VRPFTNLYCGSHIATAEKNIPERVVEKKVGQWSKTTENACEQCGIVYHNRFNCRVLKLYVSRQNLLKRIAIPRFYQENILTKARGCVIIISASDTRSFAATLYLGV